MRFCRDAQCSSVASGTENFGFAIFVPAKCTPENVLTTADLLRFADPTLGLVVKGALEAFFSLQLQCM
jgi:hypothetical protein